MREQPTYPSDADASASSASDPGDELRALRAAHARKDEFLTMLAHELRNPLGAIRNAVEILRLRAGGDADVDRPRDIIDRQLRHLTKLTDDLLDVSRINRGKLQLDIERVELATVVARALESSLPAIDEKQQKLEVALAPARLTVLADATRLAQVLVNLLSNACKYTPAHGTIAVITEQVGRRALVRVIDNGIGMAPEMLERVFEPFFQAEHGRDRASGGLGVGLTIVRQLMEMQGGTVCAASSGVGRGSEFAVDLPLIGVEGTLPVPARPWPVTPCDPTDRLRVLVVDDNPDAASGVSELLALAGHEARVAYDGPAALRAAAELHPDLVLLDIGLPVLDGYAVAQQLRALPGMADCPLVAISGYGQDEDLTRSAAAGFRGHLVKPIAIADLDALLAAAVRR